MSPFCGGDHVLSILGSTSTNSKKASIFSLVDALSCISVVFDSG